MIPKIIVYFEQFGKADFKVFRDLKKLACFLKMLAYGRSLDMAFQPLTLNQIEKDLTALPKIPFVSMSIKEAEPSGCISLLEKFNCKINTRVAFPISRLVDLDVLQDGDERLCSLPLAIKHLDEEISANEENSFLYRRLEDFQFSARSRNIF